MKKSNHHLIFEGAELSGKSYLMSQVYNYLEPKYNTAKSILDGCHWLNCDIGIFGTKYGKPCIKQYVEILKTLKDKNVMLEKFHLSDIVYNRIYRKKTINYKEFEKTLKKLNTKIILCTFKEDENLIKKRLADRLRLYPHYERISHEPSWYINQQKEYLKEIKKTSLNYKIIELDTFPNDKHLEIIKWIKA